MIVEYVKTGEAETDKELKRETQFIMAQLKKENLNCECGGVYPKIVVSLEDGDKKIVVEACEECKTLLDEFLVRNHFR